MKSNKKVGCEKISKHIQSLIEQHWLTDSQKFWPRFLFHFSDITNAVKILKDGRLFSRALLQKKEGLKKDIASSEIIERTNPKWKEFVRLYFRPRSPMLYCIEGVRPPESFEYNAHCPVPIYFVFDAEKILSLQSTCFSNGNLSYEDVQTGDTVDFYLSLPFNIIYHDASLSHLAKDERKPYKFHRHAEVIIPESLELTYLKFVVCRSRAEFETLINLLPTEASNKWRNKIGIAKRDWFFYCLWLFVENVFLDDSFINFNFSLPAQIQHTYHARCDIEDFATGIRHTWQSSDFKAVKNLRVDLKNLGHPQHYKVSFYLDQHLVYQNIFKKELDVF